MSYSPMWFAADPELRATQLAGGEYDELDEDEQLRNPQVCTSREGRTLRPSVSRPAAGIITAAILLVACGSLLLAARSSQLRSSPGQELSSLRRPQRFFAEKDGKAEDEQSSSPEKGEQKSKEHEAEDKESKELKESSSEKEDSEDKQKKEEKKSSSQKEDSEDKQKKEEKKSSSQKEDSEDKQKKEEKKSSSQKEDSEDKQKKEEKKSSSQKEDSEDKEKHQEKDSSSQEEDSKDEEEEKDSPSKEEDSEDKEKQEEKDGSSDGSCAKLWDQCGGTGYDGPTCCEKGLSCKDKPLKTLPSYRQCRNESDSSADESNAESCADDSTTERAKLWEQCGGKGFSGPTCCEAGARCKHNPSDGYPTFHQCLAVDLDQDTDSSSADDLDSNCSKKFDQCGGEGFDGPACCQGKYVCTHKPLKELPSYHQCRPPPPPACEEPKQGSLCYDKVMWNINTGVWQHPDWFKGLTAQSDFKEFQEYEWMLNRNHSKCNKPCGPGTCFFVFRYEGCDSWNEWTCAKPDDSLSYNCCCEKYHNEKNMTKPENPSKALANAMEAVDSDTPNLFCTAMCMPDSYEVGLLRAQYKEGKLGMFGCNEWTVYSNKTFRLNPEHEKKALETHIIDGPLSGVMGGEFHTVLNTVVFLKFWNKVIHNKAALKADWVVKLDPDTVFIPMRLRALLRTKEGPLGEEEPEKGLFLNNCHVGMHGPIEVLSKKALATYKDGHKKCEEGKPAKHGQEDWFLRDCFHELGVLKVDAYNVLLEGTLACQERPSDWNPYRPPCFSPQVAFHPFKTIESYMHCHNETANHPWQLPIDPIGTGPHASNERHG